MENKNNKSNLDKPIGYLYNQVSKTKGTKYISGVIDGKKVIIFSNNKKDSEKTYDYVVFVKKDFIQNSDTKSSPVSTEKKTYPKKLSSHDDLSKFSGEEEKNGDASDLI